MGHPSFQLMSHMFPSLFRKIRSSKFSCEVCQLAKHTRVPYFSSDNKSFEPLSIVHSNVWGPCRVSSTFGFRWFVTFIDECTRYTWVYLLKEKSDVEKIFATFAKTSENLFEKKNQNSTQ